MNAQPEPDLDFSRYAPARPGPVLVRTNPVQPAEKGELEQLLAICRNAVALFWQAARQIVRVIAGRTARVLERRVLQSLRSAWTVAGLGWGGFAATGILLLI